MSFKIPPLPSRSEQSQPPGQGTNVEKRGLRDLGAMRFTHSFIARVRDQSIEGNMSNEYSRIVALKSSNLAAYFVLRRAPRAGSDIDPKKSHAVVLEYPVSRCIKVTPWKDVERQSSMAIHFEKDEEGMQRSGARGKSKPKQVGRTKVTVITIRDWSRESSELVREVWSVLNDAAQELKMESPTMEKEKANRRKIAAGEGVVDMMTRLKERNRIPEKYRTTGHAIAKPRRLSQGQRAIQAMTRGAPQKGGRYTALNRGAAGAPSFSSALIGSPNLASFEASADVGSRKALEKTNRAIEEGYRKRADMSAKRAMSVSDGPLQSGSVTKQNSSRTASRTGLAGREGVAGAASRDPTLLKRRRDGQGSPENLEKRKRFMAENLRVHKQASQPSTRSRRQPQRSPYPSRAQESASQTRSLRSRSGILNEGNTCYLSSVLQALMSDGDLMSRIEKKVIPKSIAMPFSAALVSMAKDRESSLALNAAEVRDAISKRFPQFSSSDQQDAHEFYLRCLDVISNECSLRHVSDSPPHTNYSLVQERKLQCISCGYTPDPRLEILRGLSLDIPSRKDEGMTNVSLQDLVRCYFQPQQLELNCERCSGKKVKSETNVVLAPRTLVLHIKRFGVAFDAKGGSVSFQKISETVRIPEYVSLDSVLAENPVSPHLLDQIQPRRDNASDASRKVTPTRIDEEGDLFSDVLSCENISKHPNSQFHCQSRATQVPSDDYVDKHPKAVPGGHDFARRIRVHAEKRGSLDRVSAAVDLHDRKAPPLCRALELPEDEIEDPLFTQPIPANAQQNSEVESIMAAGLPRYEAEACWEQSNFNKTVALGLAMDKLKELRRNRPDLDEAMLRLVRDANSNSYVRSASSRLLKAKYKLAAVIRHDSDSIERGHYVADVQQPDGAWFCYNDSLVSTLDSRTAQDTEGYLCWYIQDDV